MDDYLQFQCNRMKTTKYGKWKSPRQWVTVFIFILSDIIKCWNFLFENGNYKLNNWTEFYWILYLKIKIIIIQRNGSKFKVKFIYFSIVSQNILKKLHFSVIWPIKQNWNSFILMFSAILAQCVNIFVVSCDCITKMKNIVEKVW